MKNFMRIKIILTTVFALLSMLTFVGCDQNETTTEKNLVSSNNRVLDKQEDLCATYSSALIKTNLGDITVKFYCQESPITVNNFFNLAQKEFYNGTRFHRVIKEFMVQGGDPNSRGANFSTHGIGGPGYKFKDEINAHPLVRGSLAMANAGANTNGSQFFIVTKDATPWLDGMHTNFGYVTAGMEVVDKIEGLKVDGNDHPISDATVISIELLK